MTERTEYETRITETNEPAHRCHVCGILGRDGERWSSGDTCDLCAYAEAVRRWSPDETPPHGGSGPFAEVMDRLHLSLRNLVAMRDALDRGASAADLWNAIDRAIYEAQFGKTPGVMG